MKKDYVYLSVIFILLVIAAAPYFSEADVTGAAVKETVYLECFDSDGLNPNFRGSAYGVVKERGYDACQGEEVVEWYCSGSKLKSANVPCDYGCSKGVCKDTPNSPICIDSDEEDMYIKGTCDSTMNGLFIDHCVNNRIAADYYCTSYGKCRGRGYLCPADYTCIDGACVAS